VKCVIEAIPGRPWEIAEAAPRPSNRGKLVVLLENNAKQIFLTLPSYTPTLLALTDPDLTTLAIRVDSVKPFDQEDLRLQVSFADTSMAEPISLVSRFEFLIIRMIHS
jgi:hypothetical protein